jgi:hypothetical protein
MPGPIVPAALVLLVGSSPGWCVAAGREVGVGARAINDLCVAVGKLVGPTADWQAANSRTLAVRSCESRSLRLMLGPFMLAGIGMPQLVSGGTWRMRRHYVRAVPKSQTGTTGATPRPQRVPPPSGGAAIIVKLPGKVRPPVARLRVTSRCVDGLERRHRRTPANAQAELPPSVTLKTSSRGTAPAGTLDNPKPAPGNALREHLQRRCFHTPTERPRGYPGRHRER